MFAICAALIAAAPLTQAHGKTTYSNADIRDAECLALFAHDLGSMPKGEMEKWPRSVSMVLYYAGKLRGRNEDFDLGAILTQELIVKVVSDPAPTAERCDKESAALSQHMKTVSNQLRALDEQPQRSGS